MFKVDVVVSLCITDIVNGKVNSIMRLVLALAAHYKPNNVRESRHRSSLASYAQVEILSHSVSDMISFSLDFCLCQVSDIVSRLLSCLRLDLS